eukprot:g11423.t1
MQEKLHGLIDCAGAMVIAGPDGVISGVCEFHFLRPSQEYTFWLGREGSKDALLQRSVTTARCGRDTPFQMAMLIPPDMWTTYVGPEHQLGSWLGSCPEDMVWTVKPSFELLRALWRNACFTLPSRGSPITQCPNPISRYCLDLTKGQPWLRSKKVRRHKGDFRLTVNADYQQTFKHCERVHVETHRSTWITPDLIRSLDQCRQDNADLLSHRVKSQDRQAKTAEIGLYEDVGDGKEDEPRPKPLPEAGWRNWQRTGSFEDHRYDALRSSSSSQPSVEGMKTALKEAMKTTTGSEDAGGGLLKVVQQIVGEEEDKQELRSQQKDLNLRKKLIEKISRLKKARVEKTRAWNLYKEELKKHHDSEQEKYKKEMSDIEAEIQKATDKIDELDTEAGIHKADLIRARGEPLQSIYRLLRPLGQGAFGLVYDARDLRSGQAVVCKVITKATAPDHNAIRNEIAVLKALDHPHILRIFDHFEHGGPHDPAFYVICESCAGGDLQQEISQSRAGLPVSQVARYIRQVLLAVNYCHSLVIPVIHRDIKPANVMKIKPGPSSDVKLIDFGLATFSKESQGVARVGGTPEFMAPEVWSGVYGAWGCSARMWENFMLSFPSRQGWGSRSLRTARDLIRKLLMMRPKQRLSAGSALKSEFIKKYGRSSHFAGYASAAMGEMLRTELGGGQNFNATPKLTHGLRTFSQVPRVMRVVLLLTASKMDVQELAKVRQVFDSIDCDHDGFISSNDMQDFLNGWMSRMGRLAHSLKSFSLPSAKTQDRIIGVGRSVFTLRVDGKNNAESDEWLRRVQDAKTLLKLADLDEDGSIGFSEFLVAWMYANQPSGESCLRQAFQTLSGPDGRCLQKHEDLGPSSSVQLALRLRHGQARGTWATGDGEEDNDSDLDERPPLRVSWGFTNSIPCRPEESIYSACCRVIGCAQAPTPGYTDELVVYFAFFVDPGVSTRQGETINVLITAGADVRHVVKSLARRPKDFSTTEDHVSYEQRVRFFLHEKQHEVLARHLLFLQIINNKALSIRERMEVFLSLYGNTLVRERDCSYVSDIAPEFVELITENSAHPLAEKVDLSQLKFKDRDLLQERSKGRNHGRVAERRM